MNTNPNPSRCSRDGCATLQDIALGADFLGLIEAFKLSEGFISTEGMSIFTRHTADVFRDLGWIEPAACGRYLRGWKPAGKVAECLARCRSARSAGEESDMMERGARESSTAVAAESREAEVRGQRSEVRRECAA